MGAKKGDLCLLCADRNPVVWSVLGNLRLEMGRRLGLTDPEKHAFVWVTDFPMFEYNEEEGRYTAMDHPFTMPREEDLVYLESAPHKVRAKAYDIVLNGVEIGGGSIRIHQRDVQERIFKALGFTMEEAANRFGFFMEAFTYGAPPHGGLAYGFDRLIMLMSGEDSIRDVIAFPKVKDASCLMSGAPDKVDVQQLDELHLAIEQEKTE